MSNAVYFAYEYAAILSWFDEIVGCGEKFIKIVKINWNLLKSFCTENPSKEKKLEWHAAVSDSWYTLTEIDFFNQISKIVISAHSLSLSPSPFLSKHIIKSLALSFRIVDVGRKKVERFFSIQIKNTKVSFH